MNTGKRNKKTFYKKREAPNYGEYICPKCGLRIDDITAALTDKASNKPIHFDCAREMILEHEPLAENTELIYLGKGSFGIVQFEDKNPHNRKNFKILKTINFETSETKTDWRDALKEKFDKTIEASDSKESTR